ncbi:MAG: HEAT repeat domain-containing protein, partial [Candidatus Baltobacteraceae bacterium]
MRLLALALGLTVALLGAVAAPYRDILQAEHARSLAGGQLVAGLDREPALAARAALAIGRTKDQAGAPALRAHLAATDPAVRAMVVYALGLLADRDSLSPIQRLLALDPNSAVRYAAADALGRIVVAAPSGQTPAGPDAALLRVVRSDPAPLVRAHAAANLDVYRDAAQAQAVAFALQHDFARERSTDVRWHILWVLGRGYPKLTSRAFWLPLLHDPSDLVRIEALRGLAHGSDASVTSAIAPLLSDPSWRVAEEANEALRRLRGQLPTDHLTRLQSPLALPTIPAIPETAAVPLPRPSATGKPAAPSVDDARFDLPLLPNSAALMNGPMRGPHPRVRVTTTQGTFVVRLYPEWAPLTVANFLLLTERGYFDDNRWFRIVPDFVVQTGDPTNTGDGDAGYTIGAEENPIEQRAGVISMGLNYDEKANTPIRDSAGTQFYITLSPQL